MKTNSRLDHWIFEGSGNLKPYRPSLEVTPIKDTIYSFGSNTLTQIFETFGIDDVKDERTIKQLFLELADSEEINTEVKYQNINIKLIKKYLNAYEVSIPMEDPLYREDNSYETSEEYKSQWSFQVHLNN